LRIKEQETRLTLYEHEFDDDDDDDDDDEFFTSVHSTQVLGLQFRRHFSFLSRVPH